MKLKNRIYEQSGHQNKQHCTPHGNAHSTHIHNIPVQAHKPLQMIKSLTATGWSKQETLMAIYKAVMRPALEFALLLLLLAPLLHRKNGGRVQQLFLRTPAVPKISAYSWWNCQATHNRLQIEINYYPDSLLFVSAGFLSRVSSQRLN